MADLMTATNLKDTILKLFAGGDHFTTRQIVRRCKKFPSSSILPELERCLSADLLAIYYHGSPFAPYGVFWKLNRGQS